MPDMTHNPNILIVSVKERWLKLHLKEGLSISRISRLSGFSRDTLHRWKRNYLREGIAGLLEKSRAHMDHPNKTSPEIEERIISLRKKYHFCALKINLRLQKEGITIHTRTIHKVLKRNGLIVKRRRRKTEDIYHKRQTTLPGELVEIDVKYALKIEGKWLYQFTAIDDYSRWKFIRVYEEQSTRKAMDFLKELLKEVPFKIKAVKTDNGAIFTNRYNGYYKSDLPFPRLHAFTRLCQENGIVHYLIDPGKPQQNAKVERSHRTDNEEFYRRYRFRDVKTLIQKQKEYLNWYNQEREHLSLNGLTPKQMLEKCQI